MIAVLIASLPGTRVSEVLSPSFVGQFNGSIQSTSRTLPLNHAPFVAFWIGHLTRKIHLVHPCLKLFCAAFLQALYGDVAAVDWTISISVPVNPKHKSHDVRPVRASASKAGTKDKHSEIKHSRRKYSLNKCVEKASNVRTSSKRINIRSKARKQGNRELTTKMRARTVQTSQAVADLHWLSFNRNRTRASSMSAV